MLISWLTGPIKRSVRTIGQGRSAAPDDTREVAGRLVRVLEETPLEGRHRGFIGTFSATGPFRRAFDGSTDLDDLLDEASLVTASVASVSPALGLLSAAHFASGITLRVVADGLLPKARSGDGLATSLVFDAEPEPAPLVATRAGSRMSLRGHRLTFPTVRAAESLVVFAEHGGETVVGLFALNDDPLLDVRRSAFDLEGLSFDTGGVVLHGAQLGASQWAMVGAPLPEVTGRAQAVRDLLLLAVHRGVAGRAAAELAASKDATSAPLEREGAVAGSGELHWLLDGMDGLAYRVRRHLFAPTAAAVAGLALREAGSTAREIVDRTRRLLGPRGLETGHPLTRVTREAEGLGIYEQERSALMMRLGAQSLGR